MSQTELHVESLVKCTDFEFKISTDLELETKSKFCPKANREKTNETFHFSIPFERDPRSEIKTKHTKSKMECSH